jgi:hypothetical protein
LSGGEGEVEHAADESAVWVAERTLHVGVGVPEGDAASVSYEASTRQARGHFSYTCFVLFQLKPEDGGL